MNCFLVAALDAVARHGLIVVVLMSVKHNNSRQGLDQNKKLSRLGRISDFTCMWSDRGDGSQRHLMQASATPSPSPDVFTG